MSYLHRPAASEVARWMGETTVDVLWELYGDEGRAEKPSATLTVRVADGRATNHRLQGASRHVISYGWRMVQDKAASSSRAATWLSAREIAGRRFFGGELTLLNLLAHTVCHEFAHLLQVVDGERRYRSVHNRGFYRRLEQLHADGAADLVRDHLRDRAAAAGLALEWSEEPVGRAPAPRVLPTRPRARFDGLRIGQRVSFQHDGSRISGRVKRINRRTVTVVPDGVADGVRWWRVSPELLLPAAPLSADVTR